MDSGDIPLLGFGVPFSKQLIATKLHLSRRSRVAGLL